MSFSRAKKIFLWRVYEQETCKESCCQEDKKGTGEEENRKKKVAHTKEEAKRHVLRDELKKLIPQIDGEGLGFLLKQAQVIVHNVNVDRINRTLEQAGQSAGSKAVKRSEAGQAAESMGVHVEDSSSAKHHVVVLGTTRKMFSRDELRRLVAIAHSEANGAASSEQLYNWLKQNRGDVLFDTEIGTKRHPLLIRLAQYLRIHYIMKN